MTNSSLLLVIRINRLTHIIGSTYTTPVAVMCLFHLMECPSNF